MHLVQPSTPMAARGLRSLGWSWSGRSGDAGLGPGLAGGHGRWRAGELGCRERDAGYRRAEGLTRSARVATSQKQGRARLDRARAELLTLYRPLGPALPRPRPEDAPPQAPPPACGCAWIRGAWVLPPQSQSNRSGTQYRWFSRSPCAVCAQDVPKLPAGSQLPGTGCWVSAED